MISFWGEDCLKKAVIARVKEHQRLDQIIQGTYWDGARGCAIGCVLHSGDHMAYETQLGLPVFLAYMDEHIFEQLPLEEAKGWPLRFIEAVPVGVDLDLIFPRFVHWLLSDPHGLREAADARTRRIMDDIATLYARRIQGIPFDQARAGAARASAEASAQASAWAAEASAQASAWAAWASAGAARASALAARASAEAARASAEASAGASAGAAWARARAAGVSAGAAGASAGASAGAAWVSAEAARVNAIRRQAEYLIAVLQSYESKPARVTAPCDPAQDLSELIAEAQKR
jgi:hypothetical protein